jgi:cation diffusion facilitator CzcD-associated flavoprotein CzcO
MSGKQRYDAVVVGAGFAGLYMLHRLRGLGLSARVFESGDGVGGTWYWNRYPGARCDVESMEYSYQFSEELQQEWSWTERYAPQPEILAYANHVADRFDLRRDLQLETRVTAAHFEERSAAWRIETDRGDRVRARFCIMATGCLSSHNVPDFPGLARFEGSCFHTGRWPHEAVDFSGQRVAVIGTGSSAIQSIPLIAEQADALFVFQRTPNFSVPAHNASLDPQHERRIKAGYREFRARNALMPAGLDTRPNEKAALQVSPEKRLAVYEERWREGGLPFLAAFSDLALSSEANDTAAEFLRAKIREIVKDPETAELLAPHTVVGCKRLCVDTGYYDTFNRDHVTLVDVSETPIEEITARGVRVGGREYAVDAIVLATGFDAMTGALLGIDIRGRAGLPLAEKWAEGPKTYLGLGVAGFPNLFTITGPGSPSVLSNMIPSIEQHVNWISDCIRYLDERGVGTIEATPEAEDAWVAHVNAVASVTLYTTGCNSWYLGANVPGKPRVFMPLLGFPPYVEKCNEVAAHGYEGFELA